MPGMTTKAMKIITGLITTDKASGHPEITSALNKIKIKGFKIVPNHKQIKIHNLKMNNNAELSSIFRHHSSR